jgi:hypothetical protein
MQMNWVEAADKIPISPLTPPEDVLQFIDDHPGLFETCESFPKLTAEYVPQLTIPGFGGDLEPVFEEKYNESVKECEKRRRENSQFGSGLTTNSKTPACDEEWVLRHPSLGDYEASHIAYEYFGGGMFGPEVSPFYGVDHAVWLLSSASKWLPEKIHSVLLDGTANWISWTWGPFSSGTDRGGEWRTNGALSENIWNCFEKEERFTWTSDVIDDALARITQSVKEVRLPEEAKELFQRFVDYRFPEKWIAVQRHMKARRAESKKSNATGRRRKRSSPLSSPGSSVPSGPQQDSQR